MAETTNFTPTDEELEEIKREISKNRLYLKDDFGNELNDLQRIAQYILDHKDEMLAKREAKKQELDEKSASNGDDNKELEDNLDASNEPKIYTLEDIEKYLTVQKEYLSGNGLDSGFEMVHKNGIADLRSFVSGDIEVKDEALSKMEEFIDTFAGGYSKDSEEQKLYEEAMNKLRELQAKSTTKDREKEKVLDDIKKNDDTLDNEQKDDTSPEDTQLEEKQTNQRNKPEPKPKQEPKVVEVEDKYRERSLNSDENEFLLDMVKLKVLLDMEIINQDIFDKAKQTPQHAIEAIQSKRPLKDKEQAEFENRLANEMLGRQELFALIPPSLLADLHMQVSHKIESILAQNPNSDVSDEKAKIAKIEERMDNLSHQLYTSEGLHFNDITNVSDTYEGYLKMFEAREKTLNQQNDSQKMDEIAKNRLKLQEIIGDYDRAWNLENISEKDVTAIDEKFDKIHNTLEELEPSEDVLKLISNFKFLDENGQEEPQFVDEDNKPLSGWKKGAKIAKGSKLENVVRIAKQNVLMRGLGSKEEITKDALTTELNGAIPEVLYAAHVASQVEKGILEDPNQFTDKKYLQKFVSDLGNVEKPMSVSNTAYNAAVDNCINSVGGFAHRLASKIGKDKPVVMKLFEPLKDLDKRAADRTSAQDNKRAWRIEQLKTMAKNGASAFLVSGAISTIGTMGGNKLIGMGLASTLAVGMTIYQIHKWRKQRKAEGKQAGFKEFFTDRRMLLTVGTTALGAAAVGFAATGNPELSAVCGVGALALGSINTVANTMGSADKNGISNLEAMLWSVGHVGVNVGSALAGRATANAAIDAYNAAHPENNIFQHKEIIGQKSSYDITYEYKDGVVDNAQTILDNWYNEDPNLLQQRIEAIEAYNAEHGTNINPQRYLLAAHDSGALSADNNLLHVQGGADVHTNGNHTVLTERWSNETGVSQDLVKALAGSVNGPEINITPESLEAFNQIDRFISPQNHVGHVPGAPIQNDGVLGFNAEMGADGRMSVNPDGESWTTYADHSGSFNEIVNEHVEDVYGMVENDKFLGVGMFGTLGNIISPIKKLKERIGSLADRIIGKKKTDIVPPQPIPEPEPKPKPKPELKDKQIPEPKPKPKKDELTPFLDREYEIVHGIKPDEAERNRYRELVMKEREKNNLGTDGEVAYMQKRMEMFNKSLKNNTAPLNEADGLCDTIKGKTRINDTRQLMWQSSLASNNEVLESKDVTLLHFREVVGEVINDGASPNARAARDSKKAPAPHGKGDRPSGGVLDVTPKLEAVHKPTKPNRYKTNTGGRS